MRLSQKLCRLSRWGFLGTLGLGAPWLSACQGLSVTTAFPRSRRSSWPLDSGQPMKLLRSRSGGMDIQALFLLIYLFHWHVVGPTGSARRCTGFWDSS